MLYDMFEVIKLIWNEKKYWKI